MVRYNAEDIFRLGVVLTAVGAIEENITISSRLPPLRFISFGIEKALSHPHVRLSPGCQKVGEKLIGAADDLILRASWLDQDVNNTERATVIRGLKKYASEFETHIKADFLELELYSIPPVQAYTPGSYSKKVRDSFPSERLPSCSCRNGVTF